MENLIAEFHAFSDALASAASPQIGNAGMQLWRGLSLIVIVWTGTQMALSGGGVNMGSIVKMVMGLAFPLGMLRFYGDPLPGVGLSVPDVITGMGNWLHGVIVQDSGEDMFLKLRGLVPAMWANFELTAQQEDIGVFDGIRALAGMLFSGALGFILWIVMFIVMCVVYCVGLAQIIWAQLAISLALLLGPVFIPFLVVPQLSFLFWGWFKTLLTYSLYAAIAAAVFRVTSSVGSNVLDALTVPGPYNTGEGTLILAQNFLLTLLFGTAALLASLQIGQFASMLLSGSGSASSGLGTRALQGARTMKTGGLM